MSGSKDMFASLRPVHNGVRAAITVLTNMHVTTEPMRPDEMSNIEQRRVTALGYLEAVEKALATLRTDDYVAQVREAASDG